MIWRPAVSEADVDAVLAFRNAGRDSFGSTAEIAPAQHRAWMATQWAGPLDDFSCIVVADDDTAPAQGYGMLRRREGRMWVALAVAPTQRRNGIGTGIYLLLRTLADESIYAAIRKDNTGSVMAAMRAGFIDEHTIHPPGVDRPDQWLVLRGSKLP